MKVKRLQRQKVVKMKLLFVQADYRQPGWHEACICLASLAVIFVGKQANRVSQYRAALEGASAEVSDQYDLVRVTDKYGWGRFQREKVIWNPNAWSILHRGLPVSLNTDWR